MPPHEVPVPVRLQQQQRLHPLLGLSPESPQTPADVPRPAADGSGPALRCGLPAGADPRGPARPGRFLPQALAGDGPCQAHPALSDIRRSQPWDTSTSSGGGGGSSSNSSGGF
ncbi:hypothetical protein ACCO45_005195 [Purpureocillium lilacinum]|uniref:Uncharacterized protein n=1 Tax=Purpureocillium lilacinum TaxID=33203 RepID=A0ACC4DVM2_PURLI